MAKKKPERTRLFTRCLRNAKTIAKIRDDYTCQRCGRKRSEGFKIDGSHVYPKHIDKRLAVDPVNVKALCAACHMNWWHVHPVEAGLWYAETWPERLEYLRSQYEANRKLREPGIQWWRELDALLGELVRNSTSQNRHRNRQGGSARKTVKRKTRH